MQRRRPFRLAALGWVVTDILYRWFHDARPIDGLILLVDFLVLLAVLWFDGTDRWHRRRLSRRVAELSKFMEEGQQIQFSTPRPPFDDKYPAKFKIWRDSAETWNRATTKFLAARSARAAAAFSHVANAGSYDPTVCPPNADAFHLQGTFGQPYQQLSARLSNLQRIIEKPDAYF